MKKSKLFIISSFALAMVMSLVMAFAMMNFTKAEPASVSATTYNTVKVYFEDNEGWGSDVRAHYYLLSTGEGTTWPGATPTSLGNNWYEIDIDTTKYDSVIFNKNGDGQTWRLEVTNTKAAIWARGNGNWDWNEGEKKNTLGYSYSDYDFDLNPTAYYILGSVTGWDLSSASVLMNDKTAGTDRAMKVYDATKDEQFRVRRGDGTWVDSQDINIGIGVDITRVGGDGEDANNIVAGATKKYVVTVDNSNNPGKMWVTEYLGSGRTKAKLADSKAHLLLATGFVLDDYSANAAQVGYIWKNTTDSTTGFHLDNKYYTGITFNSGEPDETASGMFTGCDSLIVHELEVAAGKTYEIQAQIKNGSYYVIAASDVYTKTIPAA